MLKHVGHHRSTSSMTRTSCSSLKRREEPSSPPKIIRTQDDSVLHYDTTMGKEVFVSSPEFFRKNLSSPESFTSDLGSPEIPIRSTKSGRSQSLQSSPVVRKRRLLDVPEDYEGISFSHEFLNVPPSPFKDPPSGPDFDSEPYQSSPEIMKREMTVHPSTSPETMQMQKAVRPSTSPETMKRQKAVRPSTPPETIKRQMTVCQSTSPETIRREMSVRPATLPRRGAHKALDIIAQKGQAIRKSLRCVDTSSISSSGSFTSYCAGKLTCRASSTSSLSEQTVTPVKVYLRFMKPDIEYKTIRLSTATTCRQLIILLLAKFRLRHRDPNLFFIRMEITVRSPGAEAPTRRLLVLDDQARPAELQQCRPKGDSRFSVGVRRGGLLRIHDSILMPGSQYKSLLVSYRTTVEELVQLLLNCYNSQESTRNYAIHEVNKCPYSDRQLRPDDYPLLIQSEWPRASRQNYSFVLRRNANYALRLKCRISWRRSLDHSSTDTESELQDHFAATRKSRAPSLPITHTFKNCFTGNLNDSLAGPSYRTPNASSSFSSSTLSPCMSRVSCDSGFSSPCSSSRSSTASGGSPSPPASPLLTANSRSKHETRFSKSSSSSVCAKSKSGSSIRHHPVTVTVNQVPVVSSHVVPSTNSASSSKKLTPLHKTVIETQDHDLSLYGSSCLLTIPLSPIPVPLSPPPLSVLSSVVVTAFSPVETSPIPPDLSTHAKTPKSRGSVRSNPLYTTFFKSEPNPSLYIPFEGTMIAPTSAPPSPSSPTPSRRYVLPPSPSAPTSPCRNPLLPLQSTIITIPSSGPSFVSSNTFSSASAGVRELTAALESLRTLTIRCSNYDNGFYI